MVLIKKWSLIFSEKADREFKRLDKQIQKRIFTFFDKVLNSPSPKNHGKALRNHLNTFWSYRVGDYRVICRFENNDFIIIAVKIGHRRDVYDFTP